MTGIDERPQQACRNCAAGRINCDFVRPRCTPCKESHRECTGAGRAPVFKTTVSMTAAGRKQVACTNAPDTSTTTTVTPSRAESTLLSAAEQDRYMGFFWNAYLPNGEDFPDEATQYTTCGWTRIAREICATRDDDTTAVVSLAIVANSLCMLGSQHREPGMIKDGQQVYGKALLQMRSALQRHQLNPSHSTKGKKLALIIASRLLTVFTMLFGGNGGEGESTTQGKAWVSLNSGEKALVLSSPPTAYQTGVAHQVFVDTRLNLFLPKLIAKTRTILANTDWMTEAWSVVPKTPLDRLVDLVAQIPALAEDLTAINTGILSEQAKVDAKRALRPRFVAFLAEMQRWFDDIVPGLSMDDLLASKKSRKKKIVPVLDLAKAHTLILFWAICLLFRGGLLQVLTEPEDIPLSFVNVHAIRYNMLRVLSSVFFPSGLGSSLSSSSSRGCWYSVNIALFPLRTLLGTIGDGSGDGDSFPLSPAEVKLMAGIANECKARGVASFLNSMGRYVSAADAKD